MAIKLDSSLNLDVDKFFAWWGGQLLTFFPESAAAFLRKKPDFLVYRREEDAYQLTIVNKDQAQEIGLLPNDEAGKEVREQLFRKEERLAGATVVLRIPSRQALRKQIKLPAAAAENLDDVVGYEMDRLTPFKADQIYSSATIAEKLPATGQIVVDLEIVQRQMMDDLLDDTQGWGVTPAIVDVESIGNPDALPDRHRNLLPLHRRPARGNTKRIINIGLGILLAAMLLGMILVPIWLDRGYVLMLQNELAEVSDTTREVEKLRGDADKLLKETGFLLEQKKTRPVFVELTNELTQRIPNDTWLTNLRYRNDRLQIHGLSPAASGLIEIIEASPLFENTSFVSPVTQDRRTRLERFQIAADVVAKDVDVGAKLGQEKS